MLDSPSKEICVYREEGVKENEELFRSNASRLEGQVDKARTANNEKGLLLGNWGVNSWLSTAAAMEVQTTTPVATASDFSREKKYDCAPMRVKRSEYGSAPGRRDGENGIPPETTRQPATSSGTILTCESMSTNEQKLETRTCKELVCCCQMNPLRLENFKNSFQDKPGFKYMCTHVMFAIGSQVARYAQKNSAPITGLQGNKRRILCHMVSGKTDYVMGQKPMNRELKLGSTRDSGSAGFLGDLPFPCPFIPATLHTHPQPPTSALKTSLLRATKISSLTHSSHDPGLRYRQVVRVALREEGGGGPPQLNNAPTQADATRAAASFHDRSDYREGHRHGSVRPTSSVQLDTASGIMFLVGTARHRYKEMRRAVLITSVMHNFNGETEIPGENPPPAQQQRPSHFRKAVTSRAVQYRNIYRSRNIISEISHTRIWSNSVERFIAKKVKFHECGNRERGSVDEHDRSVGGRCTNTQTWRPEPVAADIRQSPTRSRHHNKRPRSLSFRYRKTFLACSGVREYNDYVVQCFKVWPFQEITFAHAHCCKPRRCKQELLCMRTLTFASRNVTLVRQRPIRTEKSVLLTGNFFYNGKITPISNQNQDIALPAVNQSQLPSPSHKAAQQSHGQQLDELAVTQSRADRCPRVSGAMLSAVRPTTVEGCVAEETYGEYDDPGKNVEVLIVVFQPRADTSSLVARRIIVLEDPTLPRKDSHYVRMDVIAEDGFISNSIKIMDAGVGSPTFLTGQADVLPFCAAEYVTRRRRLPAANQYRSGRHTVEKVLVVFVDAPVLAWVQSSSVFSGAPIAEEFAQLLRREWTIDASWFICTVKCSIVTCRLSSTNRRSRRSPRTLMARGAPQFPRQLFPEAPFVHSRYTITTDTPASLSVALHTLFTSPRHGPYVMGYALQMALLAGGHNTVIRMCSHAGLRTDLAPPTLVKERGRTTCKVPTTGGQASLQVLPPTRRAAIDQMIPSPGRSGPTFAELPSYTGATVSKEHSVGLLQISDCRGRGGRAVNPPASHHGEPDSPAGSPDIRMWEPCRMMPWGFLGDLPFPPALSFQRCSILTSITLIGSQDLAVKSHQNLFTSFKRIARACAGVRRAREVLLGRTLHTPISLWFTVYNIALFQLHATWLPLTPQYQLCSQLVDDRPIMNAVKYKVVSGVVWTNRTMVGMRAVAEARLTLHAGGHKVGQKYTAITGTMSPTKNKRTAAKTAKIPGREKKKKKKKRALTNSVGAQKDTIITCLLYHNGGCRLCHSDVRAELENEKSGGKNSEGEQEGIATPSSRPPSRVMRASAALGAHSSLISHKHLARLLTLLLGGEGNSYRQSPLPLHHLSDHRSFYLLNFLALHEEKKVCLHRQQCRPTINNGGGRSLHCGKPRSSGDLDSIPGRSPDYHTFTFVPNCKHLGEPAGDETFNGGARPCRVVTTPGPTLTNPSQIVPLPPPAVEPAEPHWRTIVSADSNARALAGAGIGAIYHFPPLLPLSLPFLNDPSPLRPSETVSAPDHRWLGRKNILEAELQQAYRKVGSNREWTIYVSHRIGINALFPQTVRDNRRDGRHYTASGITLRVALQVGEWHYTASGITGRRVALHCEWHYRNEGTKGFIFLQFIQLCFYIAEPTFTHNDIYDLKLQELVVKEIALMHKDAPTVPTASRFKLFLSALALFLRRCDIPSIYYEESWKLGGGIPTRLILRHNSIYRHYFVCHNADLPWHSQLVRRRAGLRCGRFWVRIPEKGMGVSEWHRGTLIGLIQYNIIQCHKVTPAYGTSLQNNVRNWKLCEFNGVWARIRSLMKMQLQDAAGSVSDSRSQQATSLYSHPGEFVDSPDDDN
ncbi:hypothetical protein PR048_027207 [Dryococelus australis]|uniref:Uncharacterized protein n=1 Tax=Dryococelus australis TaxID=614101 RepID=A0ABQ9GES9_9NEOP|nr:hypothetical protein PR048_027207 [Dryococelus australis]